MEPTKTPKQQEKIPTSGGGENHHDEAAYDANQPDAQAAQLSSS